MLKDEHTDEGLLENRQSGDEDGQERQQLLPAINTTVESATPLNIPVVDGDNRTNYQTVPVQSPLLASQSVSYLVAFKETLKLAGPITISRLADMLSGVCEILILARIDEDTMAASGLIIGTQVPFLFIGSSILLSASVLIGITYGKSFHVAGEMAVVEKKKIGAILQQMSLLALPLSAVPITLIFNVEPILLALGQKRIYTQIVKQFYDGYIYSVPASMLMSASRQLAYSTNNQWLPLVIGVADLGILVGGGYCLVNGKAGFPEMGVKGMGYAVVAQTWLGLFAYLAAFKFSRRFSDYAIFKRHALAGFHHIKDAFRIGWPIAINVSGEIAILFVSSLLAGKLGAEALSAQLVIGQYTPLLMIPTFALMQTATVKVAQACGMEKYRDAKKYGNSSIIVMTTFIFLFFLLTLFMGEYLAKPFMRSSYSNYDSVMNIIKTLMPVSIAGLVVDAASNTAVGSLRGLKDTMIPMIIRLASLWGIGMTSGYALAFYSSLSKQESSAIMGLAGGYDIGLLASAAMLLSRWHVKSNHLENRQTPQSTPANTSWFFSFRQRVSGLVRHSGASYEPLVSSESSTVRETNNRCGIM